jgi:hypothetical protein
MRGENKRGELEFLSSTDTIHDTLNTHGLFVCAKLAGTTTSTCELENPCDSHQELKVFQAITSIIYTCI